MKCCNDVHGADIYKTDDNQTLCLLVAESNSVYNEQEPVTASQASKRLFFTTSFSINAAQISRFIQALLIVWDHRMSLALWLKTVLCGCHNSC